MTCGACVEACPVSIEHVDHIVDLRRHLVMVESRFPAEAEPMLRDVERASNPWGRAQSERADWARELGVRVLAPGRAARPRSSTGSAAPPPSTSAPARAAESTARLLAAAGVDFAILGPREGCTGDPARRMGNEYVFQAAAEQNVATLNEAGVTKIVTGCPHCFNTLANEYPDFGGRYEVLHHSELLAALVRDGRLAADGRRRPAAHHLPRLLLPRPPQRRARRAARARRRRRHAGRDGAQRPQHVLLRRRRRAHVDGGARRRDQRGARARGRRDRRRRRSPSPAPTAP